MAHLRRSVLATRMQSVALSSRARTVVVCAAKAEQDAKPAPAFLAAAVTASLLMGAQLVAPDEVSAAGSAGRASASKFGSQRNSQRRSAIAESAAPQVNNYTSTTMIVTAPPVYTPPVVVGPPSPFGISIVPVIPIPIPLPNPFGSPAPAPVSTAAADAAAATASAEAAAAAATAAAAAATAAAAVAVAK